MSVCQSLCEKLTSLFGVSSHFGAIPRMIRPFMDPGTVAKILATWVHECDTPEFLYGKHNPKEVPNDSRHWKIEAFLVCWKCQNMYWESVLFSASDLAFGLQLMTVKVCLLSYVYTCIICTYICTVYVHMLFSNHPVFLSRFPISPCFVNHHRINPKSPQLLPGSKGRSWHPWDAAASCSRQRGSRGDDMRSGNLCFEQMLVKI